MTAGNFIAVIFSPAIFSLLPFSLLFGGGVVLLLSVTTVQGNVS